MRMRQVERQIREIFDWADAATGPEQTACAFYYAEPLSGFDGAPSGKPEAAAKPPRS